MNLESQNIEYKQSWRDLTQFHASYPRNPLIAGACFKATLIDSWGSGISKIMTACKSEGLPEPRFEAFGGGVLVTLFRPMDVEEFSDDNSQKHVEKDEKHVEKDEKHVEKDEKHVEKDEKHVEKTSEKILVLIKEEPYITINEIGIRLDVTRRSVEDQIKRLKQKGLIRRVGPDKGGHWEIIENENNK